MTLKETRKTNCFSLAETRKLPTELRPLGEDLRCNFQVFGDFAVPTLQHLGLFKSGTYSNFLKRELNQLLVAFRSESEKALSELDAKSYWTYCAKKMVLEIIEDGQEALELAFVSLLESDLQTFAEHYYFAGSAIGRLSLIHHWCPGGEYTKLYLIGDGRNRAAMAGIKSGEIRRKQSRIPTPENLRSARQKLVDAGKPTREIAAMLAKKYDCTTDHIRKLLKRD